MIWPVDLRVRREPIAVKRSVGVINTDDGWHLVLAAIGETVMEIRMLDGEIARESADRFAAVSGGRTARYMLNCHMMLVGLDIERAAFKPSAATPVRIIAGRDLLPEAVQP